MNNLIIDVTYNKMTYLSILSMENDKMIVSRIERSISCDIFCISYMNVSLTPKQLTVSNLISDN